MQENDKIQILRDLLFEDDAIYIEKITKRLELLEESLNDSERLSLKVNPIINDQLEDFKSSMPQTMGPTIVATLKAEIRNHKEEVVDALLPVMGKLIKKYIAQEIKKLSDAINQKLGFRGKIRSRFGKSSKEQEIIDSLVAPHIEQVLLIRKDSGLLKGSYSNTKTIDEEMISGMLTAIKSFVEDAFGQKNQSLELIEYELYRIHLQSFNKYYVAVVLSGNYTTRAKDKVQDLIFNFYESFTKEKEYQSLSNTHLNKKLSENFGYAKL